MKTLPIHYFLKPITPTKETPVRFLTKLICAVVLIAASASPLQASLDFYDSFNYTNVNAQLATVAGTNWVAYAGGGVHPTNFLGSLSYPGLLTGSGDNSVLLNGAGESGTAARNLSQKPYNIANAPTLYYSLTLKVTSIIANDWGTAAGSWTNGSFMLGFNQKLQTGTAIGLGDAAAPLLIRTGDPNNTTGAASFQGYQLGVGVTAANTNRTFDPNHVYTTSDTLFIVVSYTFNSGTTNDDVAKLYVNPVPGSLESANTPVVTAASLGGDVSNNQIQSFFLRNNSVEPSSTQIDDLRVGTTWADVTPLDLALRIQAASPNTVISWTTNSTGYILETNATLDSTNWGTIASQIGIVNDRYSVTNSASSGNRFYRLRK
ncbi:hypothetical protein [Pedosphaera parvula]|uniref:Uncharacterized protein n=1 Tax=Pedosphaera parvula (strain Ellin514) TaxID=320771 RepID=B9XFI1_PEDPL|nr:hypothetical protein [Pedosphaera parvula]EEF61345.1 hypothetical protein Cflav_PD4366 [Pedosphaera parvula Ellin514]